MVDNSYFAFHSDESFDDLVIADSNWKRLEKERKYSSSLWRRTSTSIDTLEKHMRAKGFELKAYSDARDQTDILYEWSGRIPPDPDNKDYTLKASAHIFFRFSAVQANHPRASSWNDGSEDETDEDITDDYSAQVWTTIHASSRELLLVLKQEFVDLFPITKITNSDHLPLNFWTLTANGPNARPRKIAVPTWEEVSVNYGYKTKTALEETMKLRCPDGAGRLMLWHGIPGTGKSHAIRSLMREWSPWCNTNYIVDPEKFFGNADYMMTVLLKDRSDENFVAEDMKENALKGNDRWTLLLFEDADEFLTLDAKESQGQNLSRLLNIADGIIGQGMNLLILITTNAKMNNIHPAIQREGRCLSEIHFNAFSTPEANEWMAIHGSEEHFTKDTHTIAELYQRVREQQRVINKDAFDNPGQYL